MSIDQNALIDLLDESLPQQFVPASVENDSLLKEEWACLQLAVKAVRLGALTEQVALVKNQFHNTGKLVSVPAKPAVIRSLGSFAWKAAACIILLMSSVTALRYFVTSPQDVYNKMYTEYDLSTVRGNTAANTIEQAYKAKDWHAVVAALNPATADNKTIFLAAIAQMQLKNYPAAIDNFKTILGNNKLGKDTYFHDEAQYYLALSYIAVNDQQLATPILEEIASDPSNLYNKKVAGMSFIDKQVIKHKGAGGQ